MITIPCEMIVRACHIDRLIRLDNGKIMVTDKHFMAVENPTSTWTGVYQIRIDDVTLNQCVLEARYSGSVEIVVNELLGYIYAKTMLGYTSANLAAPDYDRDLDRWHDVIRQAAEPLPENYGNMVWDVDGVHKLLLASPSGQVTFERNIDGRNRPMLVRDINTSEWVGCFMPYIKDDRYHAPASLPGWL